MWRTCGGFSVAYYQSAWVARNGVGVVFGIQAAIVAVSIVSTITPIIIFQRSKQGTGDDLHSEGHDQPGPELVADA